jgi:hypothetical protein
MAAMCALLITAFSIPSDGLSLIASAWFAKLSAMDRQAPSYPRAMAALPRTHTRASSSSDRSAAVAAILYQWMALEPSVPGIVFP